MGNLDKIINTLQECADGEKTMAFGFVCDCDVRGKTANAKGFAIGREGNLAEVLASLFDEDVLSGVLKKALALRIKTKIINVKEKGNESGHSNLN